MVTVTTPWVTSVITTSSLIVAAALWEVRKVRVLKNEPLELAVVADALSSTSSSSSYVSPSSSDSNSYASFFSVFTDGFFATSSSFDFFVVLFRPFNCRIYIIDFQLYSRVFSAIFFSYNLTNFYAFPTILL